jgi:hypothetical protein
MFPDASFNQGYEEEGGYYEEEAEENFNHCSAQGKLTLATVKAIYPFQCFRHALVIPNDYTKPSFTCKLSYFISLSKLSV